MTNVPLSNWQHQMETFSALLAICAGNSPVPDEFPAQRPVTRSFDVFFDLHPNKRLSKQSWGWWFETLSCPLWRHCYDLARSLCVYAWYSYFERPPILRDHIIQWASCQIRKIASCACARNAGNVFLATEFKGNREFAIPACITACASRDAFRER